MFILTGLSLWGWLALTTATAVVGASAIWVHRRDRRRLTERANHPAERDARNTYKWDGR